MERASKPSVWGRGTYAQPACLPLSPPARRGGKTHLKRRVWNTVKRNKPKQAKPSRGGCVKLHFCYSQGATTALCSVCFSSVLPGGATARVSQSSYLCMAMPDTCERACKLSHMQCAFNGYSDNAPSVLQLVITQTLGKVSGKKKRYTHCNFRIFSEQSQ